MSERFDLVYADPSWAYDDHGGRGAAENHYDCQTLLDNAVILDRFAEEHSVLLMWAVGPMIGDCIRCAEFAGFRYVTIAFVWIKTTKNGRSLHWGGGRASTRSNMEPVLLFRRGRDYPRRVSASVHQVVHEPYQDWHSRKPEEVRRRIDRLYGPPGKDRDDGPALSRIELFARTRVPGWAAYGREVDPDLRVLPPPEVEDRTTTA